MFLLNAGIYLQVQSYNPEDQHLQVSKCLEGCYLVVTVCCYYKCYLTIFKMCKNHFSHFPIWKVHFQDDVSDEVLEILENTNNILMIIKVIFLNPVKETISSY
jgi:hypothetical protein